MTVGVVTSHSSQERDEWGTRISVEVPMLAAARASQRASVPLAQPMACGAAQAGRQLLQTIRLAGRG